jgi:hypothetical protein
MCMWNEEWKKEKAFWKPGKRARARVEWVRGKIYFPVREWLLIFPLHFILMVGTHSTFDIRHSPLVLSTIINFIHRKQYEIFYAHIAALLRPFCHHSSASRRKTLARPTIKRYFIAPQLSRTSNRKPIIDGIINVINLHNQYLSSLPHWQEQGEEALHEAHFGSFPPSTPIESRKDDFCLRTMRDSQSLSPYRLQVSSHEPSLSMAFTRTLI